MSAEAMKQALLLKLKTVRQQAAIEAAERSGDDYGQMKVAQGRIQGLQEAAFYTEQTYKELGN